MMFKPFALIAACALGLTDVHGGCHYSACDCGDNRRLSDSFLFPDGHYDEEAQEHLAQRRKLEECVCVGKGEVLLTEDVCCNECPPEEPVERRLEPKSAKTKSPKSSKSPKCKSSKAPSGLVRRLSKRRASAEAKEVRFVPVARNREEELPWATPAADGAELLAADPGIWTLPGFLDKELVDKLKALADKYGNALGHYGKCGSTNPEEKKCFRFTPFLAETDQDGSELYLEVRAKIDSIWPQFHHRDYFTMLEQKGKAGPVDYHFDGLSTWHMPATVVIYLTDSEEGAGGDTVFPLVGEDGLSVSTRKGTALTWLNAHADGLIKEKSTHGAQATTDDSSRRMILTQNFFLSPEEFPEVTGQASSVI